MTQFSECKTKIEVIDALHKALEELGLSDVGFNDQPVLNDIDFAHVWEVTAKIFEDNAGLTKAVATMAKLPLAPAEKTESMAALFRAAAAQWRELDN